QTRTSTHTTIAAERMASAGVQQNDDMRRITAWVAIVAVPTAVTGFFGQNVPYPGFGTKAGVTASVAIMLIMAAAPAIAFRAKKWLGPYPCRVRGQPPRPLVIRHRRHRCVIPPTVLPDR